MWTTEKARWTLWTDGSGSYIPQEERDGRTFLFVIDDDEVAEEVSQRMLAAGVKVVHDYFGPESRP
jgi:hypothetical protein